jgi:hypothetical protein
MLRVVLDGGTLREAQQADVVPAYTTNLQSVTASGAPTSENRLVTGRSTVGRLAQLV